MKRDMELVRKILFAIEEQHEDADIYNLKIDGYTDKEVAYHCKLLHEAGFVSKYSSRFADDELYYFLIGSVTWNGCEFLDKIRADTVWNKTKAVVTEKGLPMVLDVIKDVSSAVIASMTEGAIRAIKNG